VLEEADLSLLVDKAQDDFGARLRERSLDRARLLARRSVSPARVPLAPHYADCWKPRQSGSHSHELHTSPIVQYLHWSSAGVMNR
jgi:hypothetical protein